jgi:hypothetical protein
VLNFGIPQGPQGPQGAKGDKGDTGAKGDTGPRGQQGERGTNATVYVGTTSTLAPGSQATVYNSGSDSNAVLNFGIPKGEKGDTGSQGPQGPQGPAGPAGQNFAPTIVAELPATGDESKLYLTPKAHTTQTATGNPITATVAEQAGKIESFQLDGDTLQNGTPTPEEPVPIQTVTGEQTVTVIGKNLFNKSAVTNGGYIDTNGEVVTWETFGYSEYIRVIGGQTYSYSGTANNVGYSAKAAWYDSNKNFISAFSFGQSGQVTAPATAEFLRTSVRIASPSGLDTYQLELGSTITTYEAYKATNYPISLGSIELCKLGTYQDYIYKDGDDWKVHKATTAETLDGSEDWAQDSSGGYQRFNIIRQNAVAPSGRTAVGLSSHFTSKTTDGIGIFFLAYTASGTIKRFYFYPESNITTVEGFESWLNTNNATLVYPLATATDTAITDTTLISQLEAIRNAQLETGTNTITNNATSPNLAGDMEIGYYGCNPTNRYDKWIWLDFDNSYEQLNNPESTATLSSTRSLNTTTGQTTPTRSIETVTLKKGGAEPIEDKTELPTILDDKTEEAVKEEYTEPVEEESGIKEEPEEEISEQVESEIEEIKEEKTDSEEPVEERKEEGR